MTSRPGHERPTVSGHGKWFLVSLCVAALAVFALLWPFVEDWRTQEAPAPPSGVQLRIKPILTSEKEACQGVDESALERATTAVTGTLETTSGRTATFVADHWYRGGPADKVLLSADSSADLSTALRSAGLDTGRVLIASRSGEVLMCGESGPYTTGLGAMYVRTYEQGAGKP